MDAQGFEKLTTARECALCHPDGNDRNRDRRDANFYLAMV